MNGQRMLYSIVAVLMIFWLLGFTLHIGGSLIHALLFVALAVVIVNRLVRRTN
jgi:hypothetical protein